MAERPEGSSNSYDALPYDDMPHTSAHPRCFETIATLFGMTPPPLPTARVLEVGCAGGGNLIPQAVDLPGAQFVGVDLSQRQIETAQGRVRQLGLTNIEFRHDDILRIDESWGRFDYIICHGIFSWVPPEVQEKLLQVCKDNLAPQGVAYLSYNTYPGWHVAGPATDLMRYHASRFDDPKQRVEEARDILKFATETSSENTTYGKLFREEWELLQKYNQDAYLFHDHLEQYNQPIYLWQFAKRASSRGLQYLGDTSFSEMLLQNYPEPIQERLKSLPLIQQEQYLDLLRGRRFRRTLLCHEEVPLTRHISGDSLRPLHVSLASDSKKLKVEGDEEATTVFRLGPARMAVSDPLIKAAVLHLRDVFPEYVTYDQLRDAALQRCRQSVSHKASDGPISEQLLPDALVGAFCAGMFDACVHPPQCTSRPSEKPIASALARMQADGKGPVATLRHESLKVDELGRYLIRRLDGHHDRNTLAAHLKRSIDSGEIVMKKDGQELQDVNTPLVYNCVDNALSHLSQVGLLVR